MPPRNAIRFEELNTADLAALDFDKLILPIGSCESHGDHLPFGTDAFIAYDLALGIAGRIPRTLVLPPIWYGMSNHYRHKPMCISVSNQTNIAVYRDILESAAEWGFRKIIVINGHDGNIPCIEVAARDVKMRYPDLGLAVLAAWWTVGLSLLPKETWTHYGGYGHGGEAETSVAMAVVPDLVDPGRARGMVDERDPFVMEIWNYQELTDYGATGLGTAATREKGERFRTAVLDHLEAFIKRKDAQGWIIPKKEA
jgi:creatinine amidohydrolase